MRRQRIKTLNKNMKQLLAVIGNWQLTWAQKEGIKNKDGSWLLEKKILELKVQRNLNVSKFQRETKIDFKDG